MGNHLRIQLTESRPYICTFIILFSNLMWISELVYGVNPSQFLPLHYLIFCLTAHTALSLFSYIRHSEMLIMLSSGIGVLLWVQLTLALYTTHIPPTQITVTIIATYHWLVSVIQYYSHK